MMVMGGKQTEGWRDGGLEMVKQAHMGQTHVNCVKLMIWSWTICVGGGQKEKPICHTSAGAQEMMRRSSFWSLLHKWTLMRPTDKTTIELHGRHQQSECKRNQMLPNGCGGWVLTQEQAARINKNSSGFHGDCFPHIPLRLIQIPS